MLHQSTNTVLDLVRQTTVAGHTKWHVDPHNSDCFLSSPIGKRGIYIEFLYIEPTHTGADRHVVHFFMEGVNFFAACGTEAYDAVLEILATAFDDWKTHVEGAIEGHYTAIKLLTDLTSAKEAHED